MGASIRFQPSELDFEMNLRSMIGRYAALWERTSTEPPAVGITFTPAAQRLNENDLGYLVDSMEEELRNYPAGEEEQSAWRTRIFITLRRLGTRCFAFPDSHFDIIFSPEYLDATRAFVRKAHAFDDRIDPGELTQALRNVWVMNCLQMFLGGKPSITPSVFAYSLLYPYTDNCLDQPGLAKEDKAEICRRLGIRLSGLPLSPCDQHEAAVFRLVEMIESQYPRRDFPEVHSSLRAIHAGQVKSLLLQQPREILEESAILRISAEKGGSSVLADGWLAAGVLERREADFFFGFGVMLQLLDDFQDLPDDHRSQHCTLFSKAAADGELDHTTSRLWHFLNAVLDSAASFRTARGAELKELIRRNSRMLMLRAMAQNECYYSGDYLRRMERFSPQRFDYLNAMHRRIEGRFREIWPQLARRRNLRSIFDLLG